MVSIDLEEIIGVVQEVNQVLLPLIALQRLNLNNQVGICRMRFLHIICC